jgi:hypothetical protein
MMAASTGPRFDLKPTPSEVTVVTWGSSPCGLSVDINAGLNPAGNVAVQRVSNHLLALGYSS